MTPDPLRGRRLGVQALARSWSAGVRTNRPRRSASLDGARATYGHAPSTVWPVPNTWHHLFDPPAVTSIVKLERWLPDVSTTWCGPGSRVSFAGVRPAERPSTDTLAVGGSESSFVTGAAAGVGGGGAAA